MTEIPKWFTGEIYENGRSVINELSYEIIELNNVEVSIYDFIIGFSVILDTVGDDVELPNYLIKPHKEFLLAREWFRKNNIEAYNILID